jgi:hypothetical protein
MLALQQEVNDKAFPAHGYFVGAAGGHSWWPRSSGYSVTIILLLCIYPIIFRVQRTFYSYINNIKIFYLYYLVRHDDVWKLLMAGYMFA